MRNALFGAALVGLSIALAGPARAETAKAPGDAIPVMGVDTQTFLKTVQSANLFEISSSEIAEQKASSADVKQIAGMIIMDHRMAGAKLDAVLKAKGKAAPPEALSPKHKAMVEQLQKLSGAELETIYLDMQAMAHMEAIGLFRTYAGAGEDQEVVGFARETLPKLETHLAEVKKAIAAR